MKREREREMKRERERERERYEERGLTEEELTKKSSVPVILIAAVCHSGSLYSPSLKMS